MCERASLRESARARESETLSQRANESEWEKDKVGVVCVCVCVCVCRYVCVRESTLTSIQLVARARDVHRLGVCACGSDLY